MEARVVVCGSAQSFWRKTNSFAMLAQEQTKVHDAGLKKHEGVIMTQDLIPIARCAEISGLLPHEMVLGVAPCALHEKLLASYLAPRGSRAATGAAIVADIRAALSLGAAARAADLLVALRQLLARETVGPGAGRGARRVRNSAIRSRSSDTRDARPVERRRTPAEACNVFSLDAFRRSRLG
jgi:hypothetical protein